MQNEDDIHALLAERRQVATIWGVKDVQVIRPDLTDDQAWAVLREFDSQYDPWLVITWDTLETFAEQLFGRAPETEQE